MPVFEIKYGNFNVVGSGQNKFNNNNATLDT